MNLPALAVRRPVTSFVLLVSIVVIGALGALRLPLAYLPTLDAPFVAVVVPYPNSSPAEIERQIARPLEEVFATLPDVKRMRSNSDADRCQVVLEFQWGLELDVIRMLVREKLDQARAQLPADVADVQVFSFNTADIPIVQARISAPGVDFSQNYELLENRIANRIRRLPGVARVDLGGVEPREIWIDLRQDALRAHRLDLETLVRRLQSANLSLALGPVEDGGRRLAARATGAITTLDEVRALAVNAAGLKLADVAEIRYEEPPVEFGRRLNLAPAIALEVFKESTANTVEVAEAVMRTIKEDIGADPLLQGVNVFVWEDQAREIRSGLEGLTGSGIEGALLAVGVLYFFLRRWDSTLVVSAAIPVSLLMTTGVMYFAGANLNVLSMMGLMLGVGMLVDNAIVVLESIDRRQRAGDAPAEAALRGAREVSMAVVCSTLTSVIVFLPLVVGAKNNITIMLGEIGWTISVAMAASLAVSLLMIPLLGRYMRPRDAKEPFGLRWLEARYETALHWSLTHRKSSAAIVVVSLVLGVLPLAAGLVESSTFAGSVNRRLVMDYEFADFTYQADVEKVVAATERFLLERKDEFRTRDVYSFYGDNQATTALVLAVEDLPDEEMKALRKKIRDQVPQHPGVKLRFQDDEDSNGGSGTTFAVRLYGNDPQALEQWAEKAVAALSGIEHVADVTSSSRDAAMEVQARLDPDKARRLGLDPRRMADLLGFTLGGTRLARIAGPEREIDVNLALRMADREDLSDLRLLPAATTPEGRVVTLGEVASFEMVRKPRAIDRENRTARVMVSGSYDGKSFGNEGRPKVKEAMDALGLPPGVSWSFGRRIEQQDEDGKQMLLNFLLALALVYVIMASLFESLLQPFAILFSIPFSLFGVTWLLAATGTPFNLMANIGLLILVGVVVNNGIVLLDRVNHYRNEGLAREEAIRRAGADRLRPILMTAATTILGLLPLALGNAGLGGWAYYYPLARTVMGGLASSTVLTLLILPFVYCVLEDVSLWWSRLWRLSAPRPATEPANQPAQA